MSVCHSTPTLKPRVRLSTACCPFLTEPASCLLAPVHVCMTTCSKAEPLVSKGATLCSSPAEVASSSDIVFTIVGCGSEILRRGKCCCFQAACCFTGSPGSCRLEAWALGSTFCRRFYFSSKDNGGIEQLIMHLAW